VRAGQDLRWTSRRGSHPTTAWCIARGRCSSVAPSSGHPEGWLAGRLLPVANDRSAGVARGSVFSAGFGPRSWDRGGLGTSGLRPSERRREAVARCRGLSADLVPLGAWPVAEELVRRQRAFRSLSRSTRLHRPVPHEVIAGSVPTQVGTCFQLLECCTHRKPPSHLPCDKLVTGCRQAGHVEFQVVEDPCGFSSRLGTFRWDRCFPSLPDQWCRHPVGGGPRAEAGRIDSVPADLDNEAAAPYGRPRCGVRTTRRVRPPHPTWGLAPPRRASSLPRPATLPPLHP